jgi:hypothetical protein
MANTVNSNLNNNIISSSALEQFTSLLAPISAFSTSFNDEAAQKGTTISITTLSNTSSADDFDASTGYKSMDTTYGATQITLNKHKIVTWHVTDREVADSSAVELQRFGYQKGGDLAKAVFQDILSEVVNANFSSNITSSASDFDSDEVADLREDAIDANLPVDQCSLVLANTHYTSLLKDTDLSHAMDYGSADVIRDGRVPSLFGIGSIHESNAIPANGENLVGFLAHPSALAVAMRFLAPTNTKEYIATRRLTDPDTGIVLGYREFYDAVLGVQTAALECMYGYQTGLSGSLIRIKSS